MSNNLEVGVKITADGKGLATEARAAKDALNQLGDSTRKVSNESAALTSQTTAQTASLASMKTGLIAAAGAYVSLSSAMAGGKALIETALANERLANTLTVATGSMEAAARETAFLRDASEKLGLQFVTTSSQYAKLAAAAKGTALEGQATRDIFLAVSKAATVLGMSAADASGSLLAIQQMISKGKVSAEELRGQFGERVPGAFQMAARAIGVTTAELDKMLEQGQVTAERLLPALAQELEATYGAQAQEAAQGLNAKINRLENSFTDLKTAIGNTGLLDLLSDGIVLATRFVDALSGAKVLSAVDQQKQKIAEMRAELESLANRKHIPLIGDLLFDKKQADLLSQRIDDGIQDLKKLEQAAQESADALSGKKAVTPGAKPELPKEWAAAAEKAAKEREKAAAAAEREMQRMVDGSTRVIAALKLETEQIGLNAIQKKMLVAATEAAKAPTEELAQEIMASAHAWALATQQQEELMAAEKERLEGIKAIEKAEQDAAKAAEDSARATAQYWSGIWGNMESTGRNAFIQLAARGKSAAQSIGDAIKYSVIDLIYQITARPIIVRVGAEIGSILGFGGGVANAASSAGGIGNLLSMGSNALSIDNLVSKSASALGFSSFSAGASGAASAGVFGPGGLSYLGGAGTAIGGNAAGATGLAAASASEFGAAATLGSSFASGLAAAAGPLAIAFAATQGLKMLAGDKRLGGGFGNFINKIGDIPILGDLMPAIPLINALFGRGPLKQKETQLTGEVGAGGLLDGYLTANFKAKGGLLVGSKRDFAGVDLLTGAAETDNGKLQGVADGMVKYAMQLAQQINDSVGTVNTSLRGLSDTLGLSTKPLDDYRHSINLISESGKALTDEQIAQEIANISDEMVKSLLPTVDQFAKSGESSIQTITRLGAEFNALVSGAQLLLGKSATDAKTLVSGSTYEGRTAFVDAAGGLEAFNQQVTFFADNFLTDAQRLAPVQEQLNAGLKNLGLSTDLTRDQFRDLVQSFGQVNGISGETLQSLLNLQGVFITVRDAQDQLVAKEQEKANQIKNERLGLEAQLLQLQGNTAELRKLELAQLDPTNRILKEWVYWLQDAKDAAQKQVQVEQEKSGLETKLLQLQGNTAELRKLELAQLDPANRALQERIWLIENERAAAAKNTQTLKNNLSTAFGALQKSVDAERKSVETHIDNIGKSLDKLKSLSGALQNTLGRMQSAGDAGEQRAAAQAQIAAALAIARAGGALPDAESLQRSLDIVAQPSEDLYGSFVDYMRDFARTAADIISLDGLAQDQISAQESAIEIEKSQLEYLDGILKTAQDQVDALNGIDNSVLSLAQALQGLNAAVGAVKNNNIAIAAAESKTASAASPAASAVAAPAPAPLSASTSAGVYSAQEIPPQGINPGPVLAHPVTADGPSQITDAQIRDYVNTPGRTEIEIYNAARDNGISFARYAAVTGADINNLYSWADAHGLPRFASGGFHTGGLRIVGERGPEIEYTGPSRIFSNAESKRLLDLSEVVAELKQLREELSEVRKSTRQTADLLDDVSAGGGAFLVETA